MINFLLILDSKIFEVTSLEESNLWNTLRNYMKVVMQKIKICLSEGLMERLNLTAENLGDVELFGFAQKRSINKASFAVWSLMMEAEPNKSASPKI